MWETLSPAWQVCFEQAWEAYCAGSIPIGAALTNHGGKILSKGRNRIFEQTCELRNQLYGTPLAHAEINALLCVDYRTADPHDWILYTTSEPCPLCIGAICMTGVRQIRYASRDPWSGSTNLLSASPYLRWKNIMEIGPENAVFEEIISVLQIEYMMHDYDLRPLAVMEAWETTFKQNFILARRLYETGTLALMREAGHSATKVFAQILSILGDSKEV